MENRYASFGNNFLQAYQMAKQGKLAEKQYADQMAQQQRENQFKDMQFQAEEKYRNEQVAYQKYTDTQNRKDKILAEINNSYLKMITDPQVYGDKEAWDNASGFLAYIIKNEGLENDIKLDLAFNPNRLKEYRENLSNETLLKELYNDPTIWTTLTPEQQKRISKFAGLGMKTVTPELGQTPAQNMPNTNALFGLDIGNTPNNILPLNGNNSVMLRPASERPYMEQELLFDTAKIKELEEADNKKPENVAMNIKRFSDIFEMNAKNSKGLPVTNPTLREPAIELAKAYGIKGEEEINNWVDNYLSNYIPISQYQRLSFQQKFEQRMFEKQKEINLLASNYSGRVSANTQKQLESLLKLAKDKKLSYDKISAEILKLKRANDADYFKTEKQKKEAGQELSIQEKERLANDADFFNTLEFMIETVYSDSMEEANREYASAMQGISNIPMTNPLNSIGAGNNGTLAPMSIGTPTNYDLGNGLPTFSDAPANGSPLRGIGNLNIGRGKLSVAENTNNQPYSPAFATYIKNTLGLKPRGKETFNEFKSRAKGVKEIGDKYKSKNSNTISNVDRALKEVYNGNVSASSSNGTTKTVVVQKPTKADGVKVKPKETWEAFRDRALKTYAGDKRKAQAIYDEIKASYVRQTGK